MNAILFTLGQPWAERLGWALVQFVWEGALLAVLYAIAARLVGASPARRYFLGCLSLAAMLLALPATYFWSTASGSATAAVEPASSWPIQSAAVSTPPTVGVWQQLFPWLVMAWFAGVMAFSMRLLGGWLETAWMRRVKSRPAPPDWQSILDRLTVRMGIGQSVRLAISPAVESPAVLGWLRPMILMPVSTLAGLPPEFVEALLAHELAHILRRDYLVNLLQCLAEAVLFYHPAVWWISAQIRHERELCCDDLAVAASGDVLTYTRALADLEAYRPAHAQTAMAATGGSLLHRISRLLGQKQPARHTLPDNAAAWVLGILLMAAIGALAVRGAHAQEATVSRDSIWMDTVKIGDMSRAVRGLGVVKDASTVELRVAQTQTKDLAAGQPVALDARHGTIFTGVVTSIQSKPVEGTQGVEVHVPGAAPGPAGTQVDGIIEIERLSNVLNVGRPVFGDANSTVMIFKVEPDGKTAVKTRVEFGRSSVNVIEVRSGLQPGDKVILNDMRAYDGLDRITLK